MPLYERTPQKHEPGCWRWSNHWQCAVDLADRMAGAIEEMLEALAAEYGSDKTTDYPGLLMDAADGLEALLVEARARPPRNTTSSHPKLFTFGKRR